jgi:uncharacterized SAM-binding protein YcdF (DUF218 family)
VVSPREEKHFKARVRGAGWLVTLILAAGAGAAVALWAAGMARWLVVERPLDRCDLMAVLGGGARERLSTAVDLMSRGACGKVLFTGGVPSADNPGGRVFLPHLAPASILEPDHPATSTLGDAVVALREARMRGASAVLVVTSPYHTLRVVWVFSRLFQGTGIEFGVHPSAAFYMDYDRWWASPHGRGSVLGEYAKLWLLGLAAEAVVAWAAP